MCFVIGNYELLFIVVFVLNELFIACRVRLSIELIFIDSLMDKFYEITQFLYFLFFFSRKNDDAKETKEESKEDAEEKEV